MAYSAPPKTLAKQKEAEYERRSSRNAACKQRRWKLQGNSQGGIAHDFNNILSVIMGNCHLLLMDMDKENSQREIVEQIILSSEKAASMTKSLLAFSRKQLLEKAQTDINEIIVRIQKLLGRLIGEDIDLQVKTAHEQMIASVDNVQIEQVLMNLATNARDAMPQGGRLNICSEKVIWDVDIVMEQGFGIPGAYGCITISDSGHGMDEATRDKIFEPFFTPRVSERVRPRTGDGLWHSQAA